MTVLSRRAQPHRRRQPLRSPRIRATRIGFHAAGQGAGRVGAFLGEAALEDGRAPDVAQVPAQDQAVAALLEAVEGEAPLLLGTELFVEPGAERLEAVGVATEQRLQARAVQTAEQIGIADQQGAAAGAVGTGAGNTIIVHPCGPPSGALTQDCSLSSTVLNTSYLCCR